VLYMSDIVSSISVYVSEVATSIGVLFMSDLVSSISVVYV
jgi:hypothetical protein